MAITFTPRFITVMTRYYEANCEKIIKDGVDMPNGENWLDHFHYGKKGERVKVCFQSRHNEHNYHCEEWDDCEDNAITEEEGSCPKCHTDYGITWTMEIQANDRYEALAIIEFYEDTTLEEMKAKIEKLSGKTYDFCCCGSVVFKEKMCKRCYPHDYTRTEEQGGVCSICYENGGRWCEFSECKHQFHWGCLCKTHEHPKKCPLCRGVSETHLDPFDV